MGNKIEFFRNKTIINFWRSPSAYLFLNARNNVIIASQWLFHQRATDGSSERMCQCVHLLHTVENTYSDNTRNEKGLEDVWDVHVQDISVSRPHIGYAFIRCHVAMHLHTEQI